MINKGDWAIFSAKPIRNPGCILLLMVVSSLVLSQRTALYAQEPSQAHLESIQKRTDQINSIESSYQSNVEFFPPASAPENAIRGPFRREMFFSFLDGMVLIDRKLRPSDLHVDPGTQLIRDKRVFGTERVESLSLIPFVNSQGDFLQQDERHRGFIRNEFYIPHESSIGLGLGIRLVGTKQFSKMPAWEQAEIEESESGLILGRMFDARGKEHKWWWNPKQGYAQVRYEVYGSDGQLRSRITSDDMQEFDSVWLPTTIIREDFIPIDNQSRRTLKVQLDVEEYKVGSPDNTSERYQMLWPPGTLILDTRTGFSFEVDAIGEPRVVGEEEIYERAIADIELKQLAVDVEAEAGAPAPSAQEVVSGKSDTILASPADTDSKSVYFLVGVPAVVALLILSLYMYASKKKANNTNHA